MRRAPVVMVLLWLVAAASAAPRAPDPAAEAKRRFTEGTKFYNLADYATAIEHFKEAYKLLPKPLILFNIAQAYRLLGDTREALRFYRTYLDSAPTAENRPEVESHISALEAKLAAEAPPSPQPSPSASPPAARIPSPSRAAEPAPAPAPALPEASDGSRPIYKKWWFWTGVGAVAVGTVVAVVVLSGGGDSAPDTDLGNRPVFP